MVAKHSRVYARDTDKCMYREAFTMSRKNVALPSDSRNKLVIVLLDSNRWRAVQCSPQCTRPSIFDYETRDSALYQTGAITEMMRYNGASYSELCGQCASASYA